MEDSRTEDRKNFMKRKLFYTLESMALTNYYSCLLRPHEEKRIVCCQFEEIKDQ